MIGLVGMLAASILSIHMSPMGSYLSSIRLADNPEGDHKWYRTSNIPQCQWISDVNS